MLISRYYNKYGSIFRCLSFILLIIALLEATYIHITAEIVPYDDAFITYKYVNNLVNGYGLVYNKGQHVFGYSTPLYLIWLSSLKYFFGLISVPTLSVRFNLIFFIASAFGIFLVVRTLLNSTALASFLAFLFLINKHMLSISLGGMEAFMFTTFMCGFIWALLTDRIYWAAFFSGISYLIRPEGVFCMMTVLVFLGFNKGKRGNISYLKFFILLLSPSILWSLFALVYYGSIIPLPIIAKSRPLYPLPPGVALQTILFKINFWSFYTFFYRFYYHRSLLTIFFIGLGISGFWLYKPIFKKGGWIIPFLFISIFSFYSLSNPHMFGWYYPSIYILWFLVLFAGLIFLANCIERPKLKALIFGCLILFISISIWSNKPTLNWETKINRFTMPRRRIFQYKQAASYLNRIKNISSLKIAAPEIGALGYYSKAFISDACGLVSPEAIPFLPVPPEQRAAPEAGAISVDFVKTTNPDFIVTMERFALKSLLESQWVSENYSVIKKFHLPSRLSKQWVSKDVLIFQKKQRGKIP